MTSATVTSAPVREIRTFDTAAGNKAAYVLFNTFGTSIAEEALFDAFTDLQGQGVDDLILDLRYNGGGFLDISSELAYMVAGPVATNGRTYETLVFNDKFPTTNPVTGERLQPTPFHSTGQGFSVTSGTPLPSLDLPRVFVLSTDGTCSASESFINSLEGIDVEVILIGSTTCGKPYGFYATDNCGTTYFTIQFRGENDKGFGDYSDGFTPSNSTVVAGEPVTGCVVGDDFNSALGDSSEAMLSAALSYIDSGTCPTPPAASSKPYSKVALDGEPTGDLLEDPRVARRQFLDSNRILSRPGSE